MNSALVVPSAENDTVLPFCCCPHAAPGPVLQPMLVLCSAQRLHSQHEAYCVTLDGKRCVAKLARHPYPYKVHKCWAGRGLTPELRIAPDGQEVTYVPGGWSLVYMDYLSPSDGWEPLWQVRVEEQTPARKCKQTPSARGVALVLSHTKTRLVT